MDDYHSEYSLATCRAPGRQLMSCIPADSVTEQEPSALVPLAFSWNVGIVAGGPHWSIDPGAGVVGKMVWPASTHTWPFPPSPQSGGVARFARAQAGFPVLANCAWVLRGSGEVDDFHGGMCGRERPRFSLAPRPHFCIDDRRRLDQTTGNGMGE